jgi:hypothetical protein
MFNVLVEGLIESAEELTDTHATSRAGAFTFSPGARGGWNFGDHQMIVGLAIPVTRAGGATETAVFGYLSYELPFGSQP